jgi:hypothetical protein
MTTPSRSVELMSPVQPPRTPTGDPPYRGPSRHAPDGQEPPPTHQPNEPGEPATDWPGDPETEPPDPNDPQRSGT